MSSQPNEHKIRVGSRTSQLALTQTNHVISLLKSLHPEKEFEVVTMSTLGDRILDIPLPKIGEKALFTKELEGALTNGSVDFVVHSLKDLPTALPEGMAIGAVLTREDPRDALVVQKDLSHNSLSSLPNDSVIGTSSLRRAAQLAKKYPHLKVENIRGNLNTRLRKLDDLGKYHAIMLAAAGLIRMGWKDRISTILGTDEIMYAVGQGALAVECRDDDEATLKLLEPLYDVETTLRIIAERSFLNKLGGGCSAPVAVSSDLIMDKSNQIKLVINGAVWSLDGKEEIMAKDESNIIVKNRCATCPFNGNKNIGDNESCANCNINENSHEPRAKKQKLDNISNEILKNDPHEQCPIDLPVGVDFMGKCPYLDTALVINDNSCPISSSVDNGNGNIKNLAQKCPFLKSNVPVVMNDVFQTVDSVNDIDSNNDKLFCGLVEHKGIGIEGMANARKLGETLAETLISKGALEIMAKAQAIIRGSIGTVS